MEIKAKLNYLRIASRKVRLVANLIRGMDVKEAETQLRFMPKRASAPLLKLLNSAIANAKNNFNLEKNVLFIKKLTINQGPPFKRWRAGARGRANPIAKKTSHINLVLDIKKGVKTKEPAQKAKPIEAGPPKSESFGEEEAKVKKPKFRAPKKIEKKPKSKGLFKKVFKRKAF
jgi:large subunit ribosomal protein L22